MMQWIRVYSPVDIHALAPFFLFLFLSVGTFFSFFLSNSPEHVRGKTLLDGGVFAWYNGPFGVFRGSVNPLLSLR